MIPTPSRTLNAEISRLLTSTSEQLVNFLLADMPHRDLASLGDALRPLNSAQLRGVSSNLQLILAIVSSLAEAATAKEVQEALSPAKK